MDDDKKLLSHVANDNAVREIDGWLLPQDLEDRNPALAARLQARAAKINRADTARGSRDIIFVVAEWVSWARDWLEAGRRHPEDKHPKTEAESFAEYAPSAVLTNLWSMWPDKFTVRYVDRDGVRLDPQEAEALGAAERGRLGIEELGLTHEILREWLAEMVELAPVLNSVPDEPDLAAIGLDLPAWRKRKAISVATVTARIIARTRLLDGSTKYESIRSRVGKALRDRQRRASENPL